MIFLHKALLIPQGLENEKKTETNVNLLQLLLLSLSSDDFFSRPPCFNSDYIVKKSPLKIRITHMAGFGLFLPNSAVFF